MPEETSKKNDNVIEVAAPTREVLKRLHTLETEGGLMKERLQASVTIAVGDVAGELKRVLVGALIEGAGKTPGQAQLAEDFSTITLVRPPAPGPEPVPAPTTAAPMEPAPANAAAVPAVDELERAIAAAQPVDPTKKQ